MKKITILIVALFAVNIFAYAQMKSPEVKVVKDTEKSTVFCDVPDDTSIPVVLVANKDDPKTKKTDEPKKNTTKKEKVTTKEGCDKDKVKSKDKKTCGGCTEHIPD